MKVNGGSTILCGMKANRPKLPPTPLVYLVASRDMVRGRDYLEVLHEALDAGVGMLQMREKDIAWGDAVELGLKLGRAARRVGALFVVNDDPGLAVEVDADGVHLGQDDMSPEVAREIVGPQRLIGLSTHSVEQVDSACSADVDLIGVGPVFPTTTIASAGPVSRDVVAHACHRDRSVPAFPIGGINCENTSELVAMGVTRVAVSSWILADPCPGQRVRELLEVLNP